MDLFSAREFATAFWLLVFTVGALCVGGVRSAVPGLLRLVASPKIFLPLLLFAGYQLVVVRSLTSVITWSAALTKDVVIWSVVAAFAVTYDAAMAQDEGDLFRRVVSDELKVAVIVEALFGTYAFSLPVELALIPFATVVVLMRVVAERDETHAGLTGGLRWIEATIGFAVLAATAGNALGDLNAFLTTQTLMEFAILPVLVVLSLPFAYGFAVMSSYDSLFVRLKVGSSSSPALRRYARRAILRHCGFSLAAISRVRRVGGPLIRVHNREDVHAMLLKAESSSSAGA